MHLFRRTKPTYATDAADAWKAVAMQNEFTISTLRAMLEARDADVAQLQRENDDLVRANMFVVTRLNKALHEKAMAGRTARGTFVGRVA